MTFIWQLSYCKCLQNFLMQQGRQGKNVTKLKATVIMIFLVPLSCFLNCCEGWKMINLNFFVFCHNIAILVAFFLSMMFHFSKQFEWHPHKVEVLCSTLEHWGSQTLLLYFILFRFSLFVLFCSCFFFKKKKKKIK